MLQRGQMKQIKTQFTAGHKGPRGYHRPLCTQRSEISMEDFDESELTVFSFNKHCSHVKRHKCKLQTF